MFYIKQKPQAIQLGVLHSVPGGVLLSHGEAPHYHRRIGVSLLSSVWGQVGPPLYRRQDYSFNNFSLLCSAISSVSQPNKLINLKTSFFSEFVLFTQHPKPLSVV